MTVPRKAREYAAHVARELSAILGDDLVGLYLHGSAAMGGWHPELSDVDLLAITQRGLRPPEKNAVAAALQAFNPPGAGLEFSIVTRQLVSVPVAAPPFELHVVVGTGTKVVDGAGHPGDADLILHYAVCRERAVAILGPPPPEVFPGVPRKAILQQLLAELRWAKREAAARYAVLNACRAWAYAEEGRILSKIEGGEWALERYPSREVIRAALTAQRGTPAAIDPGAVELLLELVSHRLTVEAART